MAVIISFEMSRLTNGTRHAIQVGGINEFCMPALLASVYGRTGILLKLFATTQAKLRQVVSYATREIFVIGMVGVFLLSGLAYEIWVSIRPSDNLFFA